MQLKNQAKEYRVKAIYYRMIAEKRLSYFFEKLSEVIEKEIESSKDLLTDRN